MMEPYLEFEQEMLLNVLHENSLTITSKGIANDRLFTNLVRAFSSSCHLVLVIGAETEEEDSVVSQITESIAQEQNRVDDDENFVAPKKIVSESGLASN